MQVATVVGAKLIEDKLKAQGMQSSVSTSQILPQPVPQTAVQPVVPQTAVQPVMPQAMPQPTDASKSSNKKKIIIAIIIISVIVAIIVIIVLIIVLLDKIKNFFGFISGSFGSS